MLDIIIVLFVMLFLLDLVSSSSTMLFVYICMRYIFIVLPGRYAYANSSTSFILRTVLEFKDEIDGVGIVWRIPKELTKLLCKPIHDWFVPRSMTLWPSPVHCAVMWLTYRIKTNCNPPFFAACSYNGQVFARSSMVVEDSLKILSHRWTLKFMLTCAYVYWLYFSQAIFGSIERILRNLCWNEGTLVVVLWLKYDQILVKIMNKIKSLCSTIDGWNCEK